MKKIVTVCGKEFHLNLESTDESDSYCVHIWCDIGSKVLECTTYNNDYETALKHSENAVLNLIASNIEDCDG